MRVGIAPASGLSAMKLRRPHVALPLHRTGRRCVAGTALIFEQSRYRRPRNRRGDWVKCI